MADVNTTSWTDFVETAFDTKVSWYMMAMPQFRQIVDKHPVAQAMPGDVVTLSIHKKLTPDATPLDETLDVTPVALPAPRRVSVTLNEYGRTVRSTNKLNKLAFTRTVLSDIGQHVADDQAEAMDLLYKNLLDAHTANRLWTKNDGTFGSTDPTTNYGVINAKAIAGASSLLKRRRAEARDGKNYVAHIHPDVAYDLRLETGNTAWVNPHQYVDTAEIYSGELGTFHKVRFIENDRCTKVAGSPNLYNTYVLGREALVEAAAEQPHTVVGPVVDSLKRFQTVGWYALLGGARFRENSIQIIKSTSALDGIGGAVDYSA
ncbi:N4-gp56 family major capsid protein [Lentzea sp. NBRC 102530]|uniref:N4-gp56 family major capsid protein n=1 Tax=Lentzea sp. NBRC 102530 TaxID=3032201 RepID=UPI0024A4E141|nr:N4-gp56 family major capsid protein [Lentzea sp. NBRC 102530]GLY55328.1 hypothetical protein Lesp01_89830 [Lentzea sp. NBRC 102530]